MQTDIQQTPDGRTIPADPDPRRHVAQPPPRSAAVAMPDRADGSALVAFVSGSIAALPQLPADSASRLCLQLFLIGAGERFWRIHDLAGPAFVEVMTALLERHGLPGSETAALIEALPQLHGDANARAILGQGARTLDESLQSHDANLLLRTHDLVASWGQERRCRELSAALR